MIASIIIPTRGRPEKIAACVAALAAQDCADFEVLVGFDGPDHPAADALRALWARAGRPASALTLAHFPHRGYTPARNDLLPLASGKIMISANDDIVPAPGFVAAHIREHALAREQARTVLVSGASPFVIHSNDTLLDRLMRETAMVFFHQPMAAYAAPDARTKDWGYRHCYGLNFSAPMYHARELGGFAILPTIYGYEDIEFAFRVHQRFGSPVLYRPEALAMHDHRYGAREYAAREYKLGYAALGFARVCPDCSLATFRRDLASAAERDYSREFVSREKSGAAMAWRTFQAFEHQPASVIADNPTLRDAAYQQHLPMKRWLWRHGLLDAFDARPMDPAAAITALDSMP